MVRRDFIQKSVVATAAGTLINPFSLLAGKGTDFPVVRVPVGERKFTSKAIEKAIKKFQSGVKDPELSWLFENCFPNTLDTTVTYDEIDGKPDTYIITGDIDAMWMRDSTAQVWPYLKFIKEDKQLQNLVAGLINGQVRYILKDPYANAFYYDPNKIGEWASDHTDMKPGVHERKWEIDSLCYPIRLAYNYWKITGDATPFDEQWQKSIAAILKTFKEQQRKDERGPYSFQREAAQASDTLIMGGYGFPVNPVGLICSMFRPSDDATVFPFLVPSNFFAIVSLRQAATMMEEITKDTPSAQALRALADEVETALKKYAIIDHPDYGKIYAYEVNGFGSYNLMDDANVPNLLSLPYLDALDAADPIYQNTRKFVWSEGNPFFYKGAAAEGIGGPHVGADMIWPMSIIMRGLTSNNEAEIRWCIHTLKTTHADTGFMHEAFNKNDPEKFTRKWFAWANTLFGEFLYKVFEEKKGLLEG